MTNFVKLIFVFSVVVLLFACKPPPKLISSFPSPLPAEECSNNCLQDLEIYSPNSMVEMDSLLQLSKTKNKAVLIDINGHNCVNCRKMEVNVWQSKEVFHVLKDHFIILSLYVDNTDFKQKEGSSENMILDENGNAIKDTTFVFDENHPESWAHYEALRYNKNTQPVYDIVDWNNISLVQTTATYSSHGEPNLYKTWLEEGIYNFQNK